MKSLPARLLPALLLVLTNTSSVARVTADEPAAPAERLVKVATLTFQDLSGKEWSLPAGKPAVVVFTGTECPINNAYMPRLAELYRAYSANGVVFFAVNSNPQDTPARVKEHAREYGIPFPVIKDRGSALADQLEARRTPEAFVIDGAGQVRYRGRIDDQFGVGYRRPAPTRHELADALEALLAGKPVAQPVTRVAGCLIARAPRPKADATITFSKQVVRVLQQRCQECHRPGQIGPMPLMTFDDARAWSETIREVVTENRMPPWHADPRYGKFANDRRLAAADRDVLLRWIDEGCPEGDRKDLPPAREFPSGWRIGKPDVVLTMAQTYKVPAKAPPGGVRYQYFAIPTHFKDDVYVQAAEARPGNRAVVHHIIVYVLGPDRRRQRTADGIGDGFLVGYAPGDMPLVLGPGMAKKIPRGSSLIFQMHYTPNGTAQTDQSSVGLVLTKEPPRYQVRTRAIAQHRLSIPPAEANYRADSATTFRQDVLLLSFLPHMHLRGKDFEYRVVYPDGRRERLMAVPHYDFNWQSNYRLAEPLKLPAGTRIECTAHFDNSTANPNNPDPARTVRWGDQTWEEMMIGFVDYVPLP